MAREGTLKDTEPDSSPSSKSESEELPPDQVIIEGQRRINNSSSESSDQEHQPKDDPMIKTQHLIQGVNEFINKFNSLTGTGANVSNLTNNTLFWDYEGLDNASRRQCVSDGENDQEHLDYLRNQDPAEQYDDDLSKRVKEFLDKFNQSRAKK